ncbi:hypothetical protein KL918_005153 [Ogataea parapolymorpha]|uniref:GCN1 Positive regulator of the Gcn2p kinase activity forms a complex with Gcn20p n=1 Tax=Ogataea parapolymorpha (strain ATCC 26012 / BCRC 20466 / JCM 22074 / NRRL Y-7560 / DL-1) TaxID=871575 RepID=W1QCW6_OGAPD|nr:GCN1 Positive regulator of the Gcn2p kinase activity forms a complex with Gcn20p [Ogataea parapolymorpha DL-1]ESW98430.1 GCN1 Positive regulator of the Gcn2p kinase activity forms a complex with Gcn20p [Ogataea parapolymorpha DL-1]KAG7864832.1 hypothetical protein KL918_005153 [Ogataea parapolymorpha]KAG7873336.1 hypothetical protein KL916_002285 [Ogataea parapolymorpha]
MQAGDLDSQLQQLRLSSLNSRRAAVRQIYAVLDNRLDEAQLSRTFISLLRLYNNFPNDKLFAKQVQDVFARLLEQDRAVILGLFEKFIGQLSGKPLAVADLVVLLNWCVFFSAQKPASSVLIECLLPNAIKLVDGIATAEHHKKQRSDRLVREALKALAEIVRSLDRSQIQDFVASISKQGLSANGILAFFGQLAAIDTQLDDSIKNQIIIHFCKDILATKVSLDGYALDSFGRFVGLLTQSELEEHVLPGLEKAALRNSEQTFYIVCPRVFSAATVDLAESVAKSKFLTQLVSSLKSSNALVRQGGCECFKIIFAKSKSVGVDQLLDEVCKLLKSSTTSAVDQKLLCASILQTVPQTENTSAKIEGVLLPLIKKESNEQVLKLFLDALFACAVSDKVLDALKTGLVDKKQRKAWTVALGSQVQKNRALVTDAMIPSLESLLDECISAPLPSIANRLIAGGYAAVVVLHHLGKFDLLPRTLHDTEKPAIITNFKVYGKLATEEEQEWFVRALDALADQLSEPLVEFGYSWLYVLTSTAIIGPVRRLGLELLSNSCRTNQEFVAGSVIAAIRDLLSKERSGLADQNLDLRKLSPVIMKITSDGNRKILETHLLALLPVMYHGELANVRLGWPGVCLRAKIDPATLISQSIGIVSTLMEQLDNASAEIRASGMYDAIVRALAAIAFVDSSSVVPQLGRLLEADLDVSRVPDIDDTKLAIWHGEDGVPVVDVLEKGQKKPQVSKNSKDYETLQWEASVRQQVAAKKSSGARKLTRDEQEAVNAQIQREREIRAAIDTPYRRLCRALNIVTALAAEAATVDNGRQVWFPIAVAGVVGVLHSPNALRLVEELAVTCFLTLPAALPSSGLTGSSTFEWIGASTLRLMNIAVPPRYTSPPLTELISSQLFSLKMAADKTPFDALALMYVLPLLSKIIDNGKKHLLKNKRSKIIVNSEFQDEDPEEEQLALALELVSCHSEVFQNPEIPRTAILRDLFSLMTVPSKSKIAKDCFNALAQNVSVNIAEDDLRLIVGHVISPVVFVRTCVLEALDEEFDLTGFGFIPELWIAVFDNETVNSTIARTIWDESGFSVDRQSAAQLVPFLGNPDAGIRLSVARALAQAVADAVVEDGDDLFSETLSTLLDLYRTKEKPPAPQLDEFGLPIKSSSETKDAWEERSGVALALKYLAPQFTDTRKVEQVFRFLIDERALGDKNAVVRQEMQDAGMRIIDAHGAALLEPLIPIFEAGLAAKDEGTATQDRIKESIIILYGHLARHLDAKDPRVIEIVSRLLRALDTPSEDVQFAVAECIAPLVSATRAKLSGYFDELFGKLFDGASLAQRRGAAYGIAGLVKGAGLKSLAENDVIRNLVDAADDKKNPHKREGVSFAFETLSQSLGALFEPYVIEILPIVLRSLGDPSPEVREATDYAARMIMKNTTSYGIKKLIPLVTGNLDDHAWRTKKGSVELLGSMAYLDPTQLAANLPTIVPQIVGVLNDTHKEVRKAADQALKRFGEVIRNPEIQELVPVLLKAIGDPTQYTTEALDALIRTQFVHYIDGPSLALIIHVIHRGMRDRSATTKRKACQIVGNMAILVDSKDLVPYLAELVAELEDAMVDPVPQTRAVAARALGSLVEKLGEERFPDLIPRLLATLRDETRAGDKMGSAQALAEVTCGIGLGKLDELLPTILAGCTSPKQHVRAGFMPLLLFLPVCFGAQFAPYLSRTIAPILAGLADNDEGIRDTALRAGRLIVNNYANKAVDLLLPELERGLSDANARIRLSSVELTGDLLFKISGISGKQELSEDLTVLSVNVNRAFNEVLGAERRDRVLAALFMCRSDNSGPVRIAAVNIWKALVANTPRTVKEILPTLTQTIVRRLASADENQRNIAATTLGDMVKRVGGNALAQLLPTLDASLFASDADAKQGICIAVRELIQSSAPATVLEYKTPLFKIVRETLVDADPGVREAAAQAFDVLQEAVGSVAVDEIIPQLLELLDTEASENALAALQEIMVTKADVLFPILIPSLLTPPVKARAIGALAQVAGPALHRKLSTVVAALVDAVIAGTGNTDELLGALLKTLLSVTTDDGCHPLFQQVLALMRHEDQRKTHVIYRVLPQFFDSVAVDYSVYVDDLVTQLILALDDADRDVATHSLEALTALVKRQPRETLERLVATAHRTLSLLPEHELYVFGLPKGPNCVLPIFLNGLMYGNAQQRELAAEGIAGVVDRTPADSLRPFVTVIVGPLIRVIGERFGGEVKSAILLALTKLFAKIPQFLRPFIPQLQRTFVKSLSDTSNELLRARAARALGTLIEYQPRVDPLVAELVAGAKNAVGAENRGVKTAMLRALLEVVLRAGSKMSDASKSGVLALVENEMVGEHAGGDTAVAYAKLIGALSSTMLPDEAVRMLRAKVLDIDLRDEEAARFAVLTVNAFLKDAPAQIFATGLFADVCGFVADACASPLADVSDNAVLACGKLMLQLPDDYELADEDETAFGALIRQLCVSMNSPPSTSRDTRRLALVVVRTVCRFKYDRCIRPYVDVIAPCVFLCVRDPLIPIKLAAEKAFLAVFQLVEDENMELFNEWAQAKNATPTLQTASGQTLQLRSITEYTKRVGFRLASVERERLAAGGDKEAMFSDQFEDEREIWAVGGVELQKE